MTGGWVLIFPSMILDYDLLSAKEVYFNMIQCIVPRPIAWVLSDNGNTSWNLAPFSYFNGVTSKPPVISISVGKKRDGSKKDTWRNIEERGHFVVHVSSVASAGLLSQTSEALEWGESEVDRHRVELMTEDGFPLPRVKEAQIAMLCDRHRIVEVGDGPQGLILGRVRKVWLDDGLAAEKDGQIVLDQARLDPLSRLGWNDYSGLGAIFSIDRP